MSGCDFCQSESVFHNGTSHVGVWSVTLVVRVASIFPLTLIAVLGNMLIICLQIRKASWKSCALMTIMLAICDAAQAMYYLLEYATPKFVTNAFFSHIPGDYSIIVFSATASLRVLLVTEHYNLIVYHCQDWSTRVHYAIYSFFIIGLYVIVALIVGDRIFDFAGHKSNKYFVLQPGNGVMFVVVQLVLQLVFLVCMLRKATLKLISDRPKVSESIWFQHRVSIYAMKREFITFIVTYLPWSLLYIFRNVDGTFSEVLDGSPCAIPLHWIVVGGFCNSFLTHILQHRQWRVPASNKLQKVEESKTEG